MGRVLVKTGRGRAESKVAGPMLRPASAPVRLTQTVYHLQTQSLRWQSPPQLFIIHKHLFELLRRSGMLIMEKLHSLILYWSRTISSRRVWLAKSDIWTVERTSRSEASLWRAVLCLCASNSCLVGVSSFVPLGWGCSHLCTEV